MLYSDTAWSISCRNAAQSLRIGVSPASSTFILSSCVSALKDERGRKTVCFVCCSFATFVSLSVVRGRSSFVAVFTLRITCCHSCYSDLTSCGCGNSSCWLSSAALFWSLDPIQDSSKSLLMPHRDGKICLMVFWGGFCQFCTKQIISVRSSERCRNLVPLCHISSHNTAEAVINACTQWQSLSWFAELRHPVFFAPEWVIFVILWLELTFFCFVFLLP